VQQIIDVGCVGNDRLLTVYAVWKCTEGLEAVEGLARVRTGTTA
jgi:hypothetical protein